MEIIQLFLCVVILSTLILNKAHPLAYLVSLSMCFLRRPRKDPEAHFTPLHIITTAGTCDVKSTPPLGGTTLPAVLLSVLAQEKNMRCREGPARRDDGVRWLHQSWSGLEALGINFYGHSPEQNTRDRAPVCLPCG